ncbi:unnamed protein product [Penicillium salamii]|uniref:LysM domain-containing protein n=1 Tax=Penicillium salamii TaxID=1612424 RepID=A0A9W4JHQ1_9EURO|nr:unnamed protein product [Penicillium salamii]CAG8257670.1 unnamed protein product [Penicillium salamii]CAG8400781.1 unnamed protein product [Penicillium salamii]
MFLPSLILAAGSLPTLIAAIPHGAQSHHNLHRRASAAYALMGGNGETSDGWPSMTQWKAFDTLWGLNQILISASCDNTEQETADIKDSIQSIAKETGVDERFILAIVMQESKGCVRVHSTNNGVQNTGLMQSHAGKGSCNDGTSKTSPCPASTIRLMINDGTAGTDAGDGLKQCYEAQTGEDATKYYRAARTYNSGSVDSSGNLGQGGATHCYASDIANRVGGWAGDVTDCVESTIGSITKGLADALGGGDDSSSESDSSSSSSSSAAAQPTETAEPETSAAPVETAQSSSTVQPWTPEPAASSAAPTESESVSVAPVPTQTPKINMAAQASTQTPAWTTKSAPAPTAAATSSDSSAPIYPQAASACQKYVTVASGDFCNKVVEAAEITFSDLRRLNPGLDETCSDLWLGYQYCVKA